MKSVLSDIVQGLKFQRTEDVDEHLTLHIAIGGWSRPDPARKLS